MNLKFIDLAKDTGFRVVGARFLILIFFVIAALVLHSEPGLFLLASILVIISTVLVYIWGGWAAYKKGYSIFDAAKLGALAGIIVGGMVSSIGQPDTATILFNIGLEFVVAIVFSIIGAFIATKITIK